MTGKRQAILVPEPFISWRAGHRRPPSGITSFLSRSIDDAAADYRASLSAAPYLFRLFHASSSLHGETPSQRAGELSHAGERLSEYHFVTESFADEVRQRPPIGDRDNRK